MLSKHAQEFIDVVEKHDLKSLESSLTDSFQWTGTQTPLNKQGAVALMSAYFAAFPDFALNLSDANEEGTKLVAVTELSGTHSGKLDFNGVGVPVSAAASGKSFRLPPTKIEVTFENGKVTNIHQQNVEGGGMQGVLAQLGLQIPGR